VPCRAGSVLLFLDEKRSVSDCVATCKMNSDELDDFDRLLDRASAHFNNQVCVLHMFLPCGKLICSARRSVVSLKFHATVFLVASS